MNFVYGSAGFYCFEIFVVLDLLCFIFMRQFFASGASYLACGIDYLRHRLFIVRHILLSARHKILASQALRRQFMF